MMGDNNIYDLIKKLIITLGNIEGMGLMAYQKK